MTPAGLLTVVKLNLGMKDEALAKLLGVSWGQIHCWESGKGKPGDDIVNQLEGMLAGKPKEGARALNIGIRHTP